MILIGCLVVLGIGGGLLRQWWTSPAVTKPLGVTSASDVLGSEIKLVPWQTAYFSTQMPSFLRVKSATENPNRPQLGQYLLTNVSTSATDQVAVTVASLGNSSLAEVSAIRLRQSQPGTYSSDNRSYAPTGAFVFSRTDSYETSIFWQAGNRYIGVVTSGTVDRKPDLEQALSAIVSNWQSR